MELSTAHLRPAPTAVVTKQQPMPDAAGLLTPQPDGALVTGTEPSPSAAQTARPSPSAASSPEKGTPGGGGGGGATPTPAVGSSIDGAPLPAAEVELDVRREAAKTALDLAVVHALVSAGSDDKARKFGQTILVVGGGALVAGLASATASRVQARLGQLYPALVAGGWDVGVVPAPREVDPRVLVWKGVSVFARLESVHETWVAREEWEQAGMRAVKDRSLFL
jgi:actin-related protein 8